MLVKFDFRDLMGFADFAAKQLLLNDLLRQRAMQPTGKKDSRTKRVPVRKIPAVVTPLFLPWDYFSFSDVT